MDPHTLYYLLAALLILIGLAGTILPALPGLPLVFAGMLLAAWAGDFQQIGVLMLIVLGVLALLSLVIDFFSTTVGAQRVGASRKAVIGAFAGTVVGLFVFPPFGLFLTLRGRDGGRTAAWPGAGPGGEGGVRHVAGHCLWRGTEADPGLCDARLVRSGVARMTLDHMTVVVPRS